MGTPSPSTLCQATVFTCSGHGASPTLIDWEHANHLFLDDTAVRNNGDGSAADDTPPGVEPRPGQKDSRTALPVTMPSLKRKAFEGGGGGESDEKKAKPGGDRKNRGRPLRHRGHDDVPTLAIRLIPGLESAGEVRS